MRAPDQAFKTYEIERNRALYAFADTGIAMLPPRSGPLCRKRPSAVFPHP
jgi:hypothetical protein